MPSAPEREPNSSTGELPNFVPDLAALQDLYPDPQDPGVIGEFDTIATEASLSLSETRKIRRHLYGTASHRILSGLDISISSQDLATSLFIDTFNKGTPEAMDIDQLNWRIRAFIAPIEHRGRSYVGSSVSIGLDERQLKYDRKIWRRAFGPLYGTTMSIIQLVQFCEKHPEIEDSAYDIWEGALEKKQPRVSPYTDIYIASGDQIDAAKAFILANQERGQDPTQVQRILEKMRTRLQWKRKEMPHPWASPGLKAWISSLELVPIEHIPLEELQPLHQAVTSEDFVPAKPAPLITSGLKATLNFLRSLAPTNPTERSLTGILLSRFEPYSEDNPLGYSDMINVANSLTPIFQKQGINVANLDVQSLEDFPKAVDRLLFVAQKENEARLLENPDLLARYTVAADCVRRIAFKGVEGKLDQRPLHAGDFAIRYTRLPKRWRNYYMGRLATEQMSETTVESTIRSLENRKLRTPRKPGYGALS